MIELPETPAPNGVEPSLLDFGFVQRPPLGGKATRIDRAGSRYRATISFPPMLPDVSRVFVSRLLAAKSEGLRIEYPLLGVDQGVPGSPVVDGAGQAGTTLALRGMTPGYAFREGFWLSIVDDTDGGDFAVYLHNCRSNAVVASDGTVSIEIAPALRWPFGDGATVLVAKPVIEGFVIGEEWSWQIPVERLIALSVPIEEVG